MSALFGLAACAVSSFCFGSMYVSVRSSGDAGDGLVVQWIVCSGIFLTGIITYIATGAPPFQALAMLGGALWALGNVTAIPIIKRIGLGMGILIWGVVNCIVGWATGRFGLFGVKASVPNLPILNYLGLVFVIVGGLLFALVRPKTVSPCPTKQDPPLATPQDELGHEERTSLMGEQTQTQSHQEQEHVQVGEGEVESVIDIQPTNAKERIMAIAMSIFAGVCYGSTFTPVIYIQDNPEKFNNPPKDAIYYVFSHFTGVYLTSTAVLLVYVAYRQNKPYFDNRLVFPSLFAGILWAIAMLAWFVANDLLSQAITFPINAMTPGVIASLWSVFYFKEIQRKDLRLLILALIVTVIGVTLVGFSKTF